MKQLTQEQFNQFVKIGYAGVGDDGVKRVIILDREKGTISVPVEIIKELKC